VHLGVTGLATVLRRGGLRDKHSIYQCALADHQALVSDSPSTAAAQ
jgi:hypothetical protein